LNRYVRLLLSSNRVAGVSGYGEIDIAAFVAGTISEDAKTSTAYLVGEFSTCLSILGRRSAINACGAAAATGAGAR